MSAAACVPLCITQENCLAAVGLEPRRFLALINERQIPTLKLGKLRMVRADVLLAALERAPEAEQRPAEPANDSQQSRLARAAGLG